MLCGAAVRGLVFGLSRYHSRLRWNVPTLDVPPGNVTLEASTKVWHCDPLVARRSGRTDGSRDFFRPLTDALDAHLRMQAIFANLVKELAAANAEFLGGFGAISAACSEGAPDRATLDFCEQRPQGERIVG